MIGKFLAGQLSRPSGAIGHLILAPLWNSRNRALNDTVLKHLSLEADDVVLEIGFGGGYLLGRSLARVTRGTVAGIDASAAMANYCLRKYQREVRAGRLELKCASVEAIPYGADRFNKVFSVNSLFYWPYVGQGIGECWRVTCDGGTLVLVFTSRESLKDRPFAQHGLALHDGAEVGQIMIDAGFRVSRVEEAHDRHRRYWCVVGTKVSRP